MVHPEREEEGKLYPIRDHSRRRWYHLRKSDVLFVVGLGIIIAMFVKWYTTGTSPDLGWLGTALFLTSGSAALPRTITWWLER